MTDTGCDIELGWGGGAGPHLGGTYELADAVDDVRTMRGQDRHQ